MEREIELVDSLIKESRRAERLFLTFSCALLMSGLSTVLWMITHAQADKVFLGASGGLSSIFSALPACFFFAARGNVIYLSFLRGSWHDARKRNDLLALKKLDDELTEFRKGSISKPFWALK